MPHLIIFTKIKDSSGWASDAIEKALTTGNIRNYLERFYDTGPWAERKRTLPECLLRLRHCACCVCCHMYAHSNSVGKLVVFLSEKTEIWRIQVTWPSSYI